MSKNSLFAEALLRPRTDLFMRAIQEKVRFREHVGIEIKGSTRCLSKDTKIYTIQDNEIITEKLSELKRNKILRILSYNFLNKKIEMDFARLSKPKKRKIYKLTTETGKYVYASPEHKFFILKNSKILELKLKDLKKGDVLVSLHPKTKKNI